MACVRFKERPATLRHFWVVGKVYATMLILFAVAAWGFNLGVEGGLPALWAAISLPTLVFSRGVSLGSFMNATTFLSAGPSLVATGVVYWNMGHLTSWVGILMQSLVAAGGIYMSVLAVKAVGEIRRS